MKVRENFTDVDGQLLKAIPIIDRKITSSDPGPFRVKVVGGKLTFPQPDQVENSRNTSALFYPGFVLLVLHQAGGQDLKSLYPDWGHDDLEKIKTAMSFSTDLLDVARTKEELAIAMEKLTARIVMLPFGGCEKLQWLEAPHLKGLLSGKFENHPKMEFYFRPKDAPSKVYRLLLTRTGNATSEDVIELVRQLIFIPDDPDPSPDGPSKKEE